LKTVKGRTATAMLRLRKTIISILFSILLTGCTNQDTASNQNMVTLLEVITLIISILGALAWLPFIFDLSKRSKLFGKVINYWHGIDSKTEYYEFGKKKIAQGLQYIIKLSTVVINKSYYLKDSEVYIKYVNDKAIHKGIIFWPDVFVVSDENKKQRNLRIKQEESIKFLHVLQKDETTDFYVIFIVENVKNEDVSSFEFFEFRFINHKGKIIKLKVKREDIDFKNLLRDKDMFAKNDNQ
jgi:hypothetical protein